VDFLLDAIVALAPKIGLLEYCLKKASPDLGNGEQEQARSCPDPNAISPKPCLPAGQKSAQICAAEHQIMLPCVFHQKTPIRMMQEDIQDENYYPSGRERKTIGIISYMLQSWDIEPPHYISTTHFPIELESPAGLISFSCFSCTRL
jgi:hypothetical protein